VESVVGLWRKYPLFVAGTPLESLPEGRPFALLDPLPESINDSYVLLALPPKEISEAVHWLEARGITSERIIVYWQGGESFSASKFLGCIDEFPGETADEFRPRLLAKLDCQRQKRIAAALESAFAEGALGSLPEAERLRRATSARIAHALACDYGLGPLAHGRAIHACLNGDSTLSTIWTAQPPLERILAEASAFSLHCLENGKSLRESLRERAGSLPFSVRADLLQHVENCLGLLLGGRHVA
jgi:hypothetical protein